MKKTKSLIAGAATLLVGFGVAGGVSYSVLHRTWSSVQKSTPPVAVTSNLNSASQTNETVINNTQNSSLGQNDESQEKTSTTTTNSVATTVTTSPSVSLSATAKGNNTTFDAHQTSTTNVVSSPQSNLTASNSASKPPASSPSAPSVVVPSNAASVAEVEQAVAGGLRTSVSTVDIHSTGKDVTLEQADQMVWKWLQMSKTDAMYEPGGGSPLAWGNFVGVNAGIQNSVLLHTDVTTLKANLQSLMNKYRVLSSGVYGLSYALVNDHTYYFHGSSDSPSTAATAVAQRDEWYRGITVSVTNGEVIISVPTYSMNAPWKVHVQEFNAGATYSLDGGKTWTTNQWGYASAAPSEGGVVNPPARVLFKIQKPADGVWLLFNSSTLNEPEFGRMMVKYAPDTGFVVG